MGILKFTMLEVARTKVEFGLIEQIRLVLFRFFMEDLLKAPDCFTEVTISIKITTCDEMSLHPLDMGLLGPLKVGCYKVHTKPYRIEKALIPLCLMEV